MKFSVRTLYGMRAIFVLANHSGQGLVSVSQISKKENIPLAYLEQILNSFKRKGLVKSVRGPQGGYLLAKKPSEINLYELLRLVDDEGSIEKKSLMKMSEPANEITMTDKFFWDLFYSILKEGLSKTTLKDLLDQARHSKKSKPSQKLAFQI